MRFYTRLLVCAVTALMLCVILLNCAASWFDADANVLRLGRLLVFEARRSQALSARTEMVERSLDIKRGIIAQLIAGRVDLREAIDQFAKANEMIGNGDRELIARYQLPTDLEGVARQLLSWTYNEIESLPPYKAQRRFTELEGEYQTIFGGPKPEPVSERRVD